MRVDIDLNVRVRGNCTYSGFEDIVGPRVGEVGDVVEVAEPEAGLIGAGRIVEIDSERELIYLDVDWMSLRNAS